MRSVAWGVVALYILGAVVGLLLDLRWYAEWGADLPIAHVLGADHVWQALLVTLPITGAVIVSRIPRHPIGWLMLAGAAVFALGNVGGSYAKWTLAGTSADPSVSAVIGAWFSTWSFVPGMILAFVLVPLLFPDGRPPSPRWRPIVWAAGGLVLAAFAEQAFQARLVGRVWTADRSERLTIYDVSNPVAVEALGLAGWVGDIAGGLVGVALAIVFLAALAAPAVRYRRARGTERQQVKWLALAAAALVVTAGASEVAVGQFGVPRHVGDPFWYTAAAAIPAAVGIAIVRYRLYEIDRLISRTVSYGLVVAVLGAVYVAGVVGLGAVVSGFAGEQGSDLVVAASVLAVAALFRPVRTRVQQTVDRRFNRSRYEARLIVERFAHELTDEVDPDEITDRLGTVAAVVVQPTQLSVWLAENESRAGPDDAD